MSSAGPPRHLHLVRDAIRDGDGVRDAVRDAGWDAARGAARDAGSARSAADEPVEDRLARLAAAVGPLRRGMAAIAARWVAVRGHERLGFARLADYARERPGISARQVRELARVHRALAALPRLERALVSNLLPWSQVRAIARVATADDEAGWIAFARTVSARRLEAEVRRSAAGSAGSDRSAGSEGMADPGEAPRRRVAVRCTPAVRETWGRVCEVAERVAGERLCGADVLEAVVAEGFATLAGEAARWVEAPASAADAGAGRGRPTCAHGGERGGDPAPPRRVVAPPRLPEAVVALVAGLEEADALELDRRLRRAVRLEQTLDAAIAPLLRVVRSAEYEWQGEAPRTLAGYAADQLGLSGRKARALVRLERAGDLCPALREAWRRGRISWTKAQVLVPLLGLDLDDDPGGGDWREAWVDWARRVTVRRLAEDVERALLLRAGTHRAWHRCKARPERVREPVAPEDRPTCAHDATEVLSWRVPAEVALLFVAVREALRVRAPTASDGEILETLLDHALATWGARDPRARRPDPVIARDGYRCAVPGCTSRRSLHDHHVRFRSVGGSDDPANRITLCAFHHLRGVHGGALRITGRAPDALRFETPFGRYRSGDVREVSAGLSNR